MSIFNLFKKKETEEKEIKKEYNPATEEDEDEITAVISSVLACMDEEEETVAAIISAIATMLGKSTNEFIVRNIKRTTELDSIWAQAGRMKLMR